MRSGTPLYGTAGARSVLVSLWAIDDKATLGFMRYFYQHLMDGNCASKLVNQAMKCMRETDDFNYVRYWVPFVLIGDDVTMNFAETRRVLKYSVLKDHLSNVHDMRSY